jgi:hypothetical protein
MRIAPEEIKAQVVSLHEAALVTWKLRSQKQAPGSGNQEEADLSIQLHKPGEDSPRYTIKVVDRSTMSKGAAHKFVAFVVPQGRQGKINLNGERTNLYCFALGKRNTYLLLPTDKSK